MEGRRFVDMAEAPAHHHRERVRRWVGSLNDVGLHCHDGGGEGARRVGARGDDLMAVRRGAKSEGASRKGVSRKGASQRRVSQRASGGT